MESKNPEIEKKRKEIRKKIERRRKEEEKKKHREEKKSIFKCISLSGKWNISSQKENSEEKLNKQKQKEIEKKRREIRKQIENRRKEAEKKKQKEERKKIYKGITFSGVWKSNSSKVKKEKDRLLSQIHGLVENKREENQKRKDEILRKRQEEKTRREQENKRLKEESKRKKAEEKEKFESKRQKELEEKERSRKEKEEEIRKQKEEKGKRKAEQKERLEIERQQKQEEKEKKRKEKKKKISNKTSLFGKWKRKKHSIIDVGFKEIPEGDYNIRETEETKKNLEKLKKKFDPDPELVNEIDLAYNQEEWKKLIDREMFDYKLRKVLRKMEKMLYVAGVISVCLGISVVAFEKSKEYTVKIFNLDKRKEEIEDAIKEREKWRKLATLEGMRENAIRRRNETIDFQYDHQKKQESQEDYTNISNSNKKNNNYSKEIINLSYNIERDEGDR